jgi:3-isopropylmalate dehydrogenase
MGARDFPDIKRDYAHVDALVMWMVKNPEWFDVIVTSNMFGDIITDLGAIIQGGMGIAAGANINPEGTSMFEPIGGSAPKYAGQGIINPLACILAGHLMLDHLGESVGAALIENAVIRFLASGRLKGLSAAEIKGSGLTAAKIGDAVAGYVASA